EPAPEPACSDATYQAEEMPWSGTDGVDGEVRTDPAPTHRYFWTDGYIHKNHVFAAGPTPTRAPALGDPPGGTRPHTFGPAGGGGARVQRRDVAGRGDAVVRHRGRGRRGSDRASADASILLDLRIHPQEPRVRRGADADPGPRDGRAPRRNRAPHVRLGRRRRD